MTVEKAAQHLRSFFKTYKRLPSYQEMCILFGFASKKASYVLAQKLIEQGFIEKDSKGRLIPKQLFPPLRLLGTIRAGIPSFEEQQLLDTMSFDGYLVNKPERSYLLKVSGDSMIEAGINPGDLVVIEETQTPSDGDIVVSEIDGGFTLKYFRYMEGRPVLVPANKQFSPLYPQEELRIIGKVISVIRKYH